MSATLPSSYFYSEPSFRAPARPVTIERMTVMTEGGKEANKGMMLFGGILAGAAIVGLTMAAVSWWNRTHPNVNPLELRAADQQQQRLKQKQQ